MAKLAGSVAAIRVAVRQAIVAVPEGGLVLVACSGGPDSMALAAGVAFEAPRKGRRMGLVTVDHGLQSGSARRANDVTVWAAKAGFSPADAITVAVGTAGGPEAAARTARYAALAAAASRLSASAVFLGHTRDDQAETVLLALARGSGARALSGMPVQRGLYRRPLLDVARATTHDACAAENIPVWHDPHNVDPAYARSRLRKVVPLLEDTIGPGVTLGLTRSARLLRDDADYLDAIATERFIALTADTGTELPTALAAEPSAIRRRVLRQWALSRGVPAGALAISHIDALDALLVEWRGQGATCLPGGATVSRNAGRLVLQDPVSPPCRANGG